MSYDTVVIGAGLAGLTCARDLVQAGQKVLVLEASDGVGGRVRTDEHEGFLLDRGFQVLLTAYPQAKRVLDYPALELQPFYPGSLVRSPIGTMEKLADPFRQPVDGLKTLGSSVGSMGDKMRIGQMRARLMLTSLDAIYESEEDSARHWLIDQGFSKDFISQFFRPFYGGVMLDENLSASKKMLEFTYKMFAQGDTSVPAAGMGAITAQIADHIGEQRIRLGSRVKQVSQGSVTLENGERIKGDQVVVATDVDFAHEQIQEIQNPGWRGVSCLYFDAPEPPVKEPILVLNGDAAGMVNNLAVMSQVAPTYAPKGRSLVSVSVVGGAPREALTGRVIQELTGWFGKQVSHWRHLRTYDIPKGQPAQDLSEVMRPVHTSVSGVFVCGDHRETPSIEGAMHSGQRAAHAVLDA